MNVNNYFQNVIKVYIFAPAQEPNRKVVSVKGVKKPFSNPKRFWLLYKPHIPFSTFSLSDFDRCNMLSKTG